MLKRCLCNLRAQPGLIRAVTPLQMTRAPLPGRMLKAMNNPARTVPAAGRWLTVLALLGAAPALAQGVPQPLPTPETCSALITEQTIPLPGPLSEALLGTTRAYQVQAEGLQARYASRPRLLLRRSSDETRGTYWWRSCAGCCTAAAGSGRSVAAPT